VSALPPPAPDCAACAARDERIAAQQELIGELRDAVGAQADQIAALREQVTRLERALSRNSGNSSMPPSGDDAPGRKPPRRQRRAAEREEAKKRKRGKQPGAPGSAMCWAEPDDTRDHYPRGTCECGADLAAAQDLGVARSYQQLEIPEPSAERIQHDLHLGLCGCGRQQVAARPPGVPDAPVSIGPNLRALAVYLLVFQHVPVERCRQLISDAAGAQVSAGFIHSCLRKAAGLAADVIKLIATLITAARVAGFDETTLRAGAAGQKKYVLGAFTEQYSLLHLGDRTLESMRDFGILPDFAGVVVSDRYQNYVRHEAHCYIAC
jgi:transposase